MIPLEKEFNDTGLCIPSQHYMVDTSQKIETIIQLIEKGKYFTINRPRQFGKTTTLSLLANRLNKRDDYVALEITFEEIDLDSYQKQDLYSYELLMMILSRLEFLNLTEAAHYVEQHVRQISTMPALSRFITKFIRDMLPGKSVILLIDEVDKNSNNPLFWTFLGVLRNKYLQQNKGQDTTFHAVILAGVHDIKTLKAKIRPASSQGEGGYNSPWNIAVDFEVDLSFAALEIETMLQDYCQEKNIQADIPTIAEKLYYYTSGYPYLVSKLCKFIDEKIVPQRVYPEPSRRADKNWSVEDVETAFKMIVNEGYTTTLFDSLAKNLENNPELYALITQIAINGLSFPFTISNPVINFGHLYGILVPSEQGRCQIHNRIFEQRIYAHIMSKLLQTKYREINGWGGPEFYTTEGLDIKLILERFQIFMKEHYSSQDAQFLEREGRLLFLSYLRPIINGRGFDFKEPNVSQERRMDLVVTYQNKRYVIELKIWHGPKYHQEGLKQLSDYLDTYSLKEGYLFIYNFNKNKTYKQEDITFEDKQIFGVWV